MACDLTQNFTIDCINSKGGVKILYIADFDDLDTAPTIVAGAITVMALATGKKFWTYNLERANASFAQSAKKDLNNGSLYHEMKYDWNKKKMDVASQNEIQILLQKRLMAIHLDNNGLYWCTGITNGLDLMTSDAGSGKALADLNGYTLSMTGEEPSPAYSISSAIVATLIVPAL